MWNAVKATQVVHKEKMYRSDKHVTNVKYKLAYFDCFPSNACVFFHADE